VALTSVTDHRTPPSGREGGRGIVAPWVIATAVAALAVSNVMSNRVLPAAWYVPWNLTVAIALVALALGPGRRRVVELGLGRRDAARGLRWGALLAAIVLAIYLVGVAIPATRDLFRDKRVIHTGLGALAFSTLVRIPLGTVVLEELAFRAVLPALFAPRFGRWRAALVASVLFGLWHILPAWHLNHMNPVATTALAGTAGQLVAVSGGVLATAVAGMGLCWLRMRSRSIVAPLLVHLATNSLAFLFAWLVIS
jgi:uncharacterized protein